MKWYDYIRSDFMKDYYKSGNGHLSDEALLCYMVQSIYIPVFYKISMLEDMKFTDALLDEDRSLVLDQLKHAYYMLYNDDDIMFDVYDLREANITDYSNYDLVDYNTIENHFGIFKSINDIIKDFEQSENPEVTVFADGYDKEATLKYSLCLHRDNENDMLNITKLIMYAGNQLEYWACTMKKIGKLPFNNGDRVSLKLPSMKKPIYGYFYSEGYADETYVNIYNWLRKDMNESYSNEYDLTWVQNTVFGEYSIFDCINPAN